MCPFVISQHEDNHSEFYCGAYKKDLNRRITNLKTIEPVTPGWCNIKNKNHD